MIVNKNLDVLGKSTLHKVDVFGESTFHKHIKTKEGISTSGNLKVGKNAKFKENVTIDGTLSVGDFATLGCLNKLCVKNLSAIDESISGTLSVNNAYIVNGAIENLTVTATVLDSVINNLTVQQTLSANDAVIQNLSVSNCISDLCVNNLSVVNESVSGTLSVNNAVVQNLTSSGGAISITDTVIQNSSITNLSADDAIIQNVTIVNCIPDLCVENISVDNAVINNVLQLQDPGPGYIGLQAPTTVPTSYTLSFPAAIPTGNQVLRANATTPTDLEWANVGSGSVPPATSKTIYVTTYGNDITGDGSFDNPYASLAKAITLANSLASSMNPITISISTGIYIEDNSMGPLTVTADGVAIIGEVSSNVILIPNTPTNDFLLINSTIHISEVAFESFAPLATGITFAAGNLSAIINVDFINFLIGADCLGGATNSYGFINCFFADNGTAVNVNNAYVEMVDNHIFGTTTLLGSNVNNAITVTGSGANLVMSSGVIEGCLTGIALENNATASITSVALRYNTFDITQNGASHLTLSSCTFEITTSSSDIDIKASGAGTITQVVGCEFSGSGVLGNPEGTCIYPTNNALVNISGGSMHNYTTGIIVGSPSDTSSTMLSASALVIQNCTTDIIQQGSSTLNFNASTASSSKIIINDPTNVDLAFFDLEENNALTIGSTANIPTTLIQAAVTPSNQPTINYLPSLYSSQAIGIDNFLSTPTSLFIVTDDNANLTSVTTDRSKTSTLQLFSDEGVTVGGTSALRGWEIQKNSNNAELVFNYQNSDSSGQSPVSKYTVMQLDGFNNQLQLPTSGTQIVFGGDTNLYRNAADVLKTDDNFVVGTLTAGKAIATDPITNEFISSTATNTELNYLSGVTSPIQTQLNNKVSRSGDSMTGTLSMLTQNAIHFNDAVGNFVGINAQTSVPTSYTLSLPTTVPTAHQIMRANGTTPTNLEWVTTAGSQIPANSKVIYVTKYGNDITGDGSFSNPYASLAQAINVANSLATSSNPICIS
ncbi:MAG TPA: hypothetical protein VKR58_00030, partial [Aquella sp.]|nr:hypothetical protein [Aquella sp.]